MLMTLCLLAFIGSAYSSCTCGPSQFQAVFGEFGTKNSQIITGYAHLYYDYINKRVETRNYLFNGTTKEYSFIGRYIRFYTLGHGYTIDADGNCTSYTFNETMRSPCIPVDAHLLGSNTLGYKWEHINYNGYYFKNPANDKERVFLLLSQDQCIPLVQFIYDETSADSKATTQIITGFSDKINPVDAAFKIPIACSPPEFL